MDCRVTQSGLIELMEFLSYILLNSRVERDDRDSYKSTMLLEKMEG